MHILFITHDINSGGSARSLSVLVRALAKRHRISILSMQAPDENKGFSQLYKDAGVNVYSFAWGWLPVHYINCRFDMDQQRKICEKQKPYLAPVQKLADTADVICFNSYPSTSLASALNKRIRKVLIARDVMDEKSPNFASIISYLRRYLSAAAAIGPVEARQLAAARIPHTVVFNTSPETPRFRPFPPSPPVHFGTFGQYLNVKGQDILLTGCAAVANQLREASAVVHFFGGPVPDSFKSFVEQNGLQDIIRLEGWVDDVEKHMAEMHCIVRPDRTGSPWGRDIIEAMSIGRPVLATGSEEIFVKPDVTGWLVQPDAAAGLGLSMTLLAKNARTLEKTGQNAFAFAREHFDPEENAKKIESILLCS